jgi:hypothetical protein
MSYKHKPIFFAAGFIIFSMIAVFTLPSGKQSARTEILEQCQNGKSVTIDGVEIHCGVISSKSIKEWNNEP